MTIDRFSLNTRLYGNMRLALELIDGFEPWGVLTTNLVHAELAEDEICIPVWNLPEDLVSEYLSSGKFEDTGRKEVAGHADAPVWRVVCPEILASAARQRAAA